MAEEATTKNKHLNNFMSDILNKTTVLVLNRNWQAIHVRTPQEAFCMMATNVATALEIEGDVHPSSVAPPLGGDRNSMLERGSRESRSDWTLRRVDIRPVTWEEWITLPIRPHDNAVQTMRGPIRVPTVVVAVNFAKVPKKRPKLCAKTIRERDGNRCQYTGKMLRPDEGSLDHVLPRSRGGKDEWGNLVWSDKTVNAHKGNRLPHEAGLRLLSVPRAPKELPASALIRNAHEIADWELFVKG
jgi:5-methylcytosine-specific restriction endonuclease McrA